MKIWKLFSVLALSVLLVAMLAACEGGSSGGTTQSGGQGDGVATSTGGSQSTGGCTTAASCQKAIVNVTPNQVKRGGKVTVTVKGWVANAKLQASIGVQAVDSDIVSATSDAQGNFSVTLTIDPRTTDIGPTNVNLGAGDVSKDLTVDNQLTIIG